MEVSLSSSSHSLHRLGDAIWAPWTRPPFISSCHRHHSASLHRHVSALPWTRRTRVGAPPPSAKPRDQKRPSTLDYHERGSPDTEEPLAEEEARRKDWVERGWAPWEEILSAEAQFAIDSLGTGKKHPELLRKSFHKLTARADAPEEQASGARVEDAHKEEEGEEGEEEEAEEAAAEEKKAEEVGPPLPLQVFSVIPPRDWPPPGWKVDPTELAFIREAISQEDARVSFKDLEDAKPLESYTPSLPRWNTFLKQYHQWVAANKDFLDQEAIESEEEYYPGRRRTGELYQEGMFELPFVYPGQHYLGVVTCVHLYEGAFVNYGGVHDGWVPIRDNDWYYIRHHIKVGMVVQVEVLAKRDPYRFRFPIEMRFVYPNIDHLIFRRFEYPPIFIGADDTNSDELSRETGRPYVPRRRPDVKEKEPAISHHPYSPQILQIHIAEEAVLDREDGSDLVYDSDGTLLEDFSAGDAKHCDPDATFWIDENCPVDDTVIPKIVVIQDMEELDLEAARAERQAIHKMCEEADANGEEFIMPKLRRELQMEELDKMHKQRIMEESEALQRDISCRIEMGLPLEEPGRYADPSFFGKNQYNPMERKWRNDYFSDFTRFKKDAQNGQESCQNSTTNENEHPKGLSNNDEINQDPTNGLGDKQLVNGIKDDEWQDRNPNGS